MIASSSALPLGIRRGTSSLTRHEWIVLGLLVALSTFVHFELRIAGFGEQDQARFGIFVLVWRETGLFPLDTYVHRTSPLYLIYLNHAFASGLSRADLAEHMNRINVVFGSLLLLPLYLVFRRLAQDRLTALIALAMYWFVPAYFFGNGYGMPHLPALAFWLSSLVLFQHALDGGRHANLARGGALVAIAIATCLKSDIVMCGLAFPALVWCLGHESRKNLLFAVLVPSFGTVAALLVSRFFVPVPETVTEFAVSWNAQFPFALGAIPGGIKITTRSLGLVSWIATVLAAAVGVRRGRLRLVVLTAVWALPTIVFWGLIWASTPRHLAMALCPVPLLIAVAATELLRSPAKAAAAAFAIVTLNYWVAPAKSHPHNSTPRLFASIGLMRRFVEQHTQSARAFAEHPAKRKLLTGFGLIPYYEYALIESAVRFTRTVTEPGASWEMKVWKAGETEPTTIRVARALGAQAADGAEPGWLVWDAETAGPAARAGSARHGSR
jgi:hypothetical protein